MENFYFNKTPEDSYSSFNSFNMKFKSNLNNLDYIEYPKKQFTISNIYELSIYSGISCNNHNQFDCQSKKLKENFINFDNSIDFKYQQNGNENQNFNSNLEINNFKNINNFRISDNYENENDNFHRNSNSDSINVIQSNFQETETERRCAFINEIFNHKKEENSEIINFLKGNL